MNPRSLRRLAADHAALHTSELPPNYLFDPNSDTSSDLTQLDILLAGPQSTPYELGVFKLHLSIPATYPTDPPKAFFRTKIFHPNIEPETGAVCVETLKRDWKDTLTLRHVLVTISCLLVYPNASSALNAEAGMLLEGGGGEGWEGFEKRAKLMTRLQAGVPKLLKDAVKEAQTRGEVSEEEAQKETRRTLRKQESESNEYGAEGASGVAERKERRTTRRRGVVDHQDLPRPSGIRTRSTRTSQLASTPMNADMPPPPRPFVTSSALDDVFGSTSLPPPSQLNQETPPTRPATVNDDDSISEMQHGDQENKASSTSVLASKPALHPSLIRNGPSIPLGELSLYDPMNESDGDNVNSNDSSAFLSDSMEAEYPPSPRKSPVKTQRNTSEEHYSEYPPSPRKQSPQKRGDLEHPPSPRKQSPVKGGRGLLFPQPSSSSDIFGSSAAPGPRPDFFRAESSHSAATRGGGGPLFTPQMNNEMHPALFSTQETPDLASMTEGSEFEMSFEVLRQSEREKKNLLASPPRRKTKTKFRSRAVSPELALVDDDSDMVLEDSIFVGGRQLRSGTVTPRLWEGARSTKRQVTPPVVSEIAKTTAVAGKRSPRVEKTPASATKTSKTAEDKRREEMESKLWELCGGDVDRWNRGDFGRGADFMNIKTSRW